MTKGIREDSDPKVLHIPSTAAPGQNSNKTRTGQHTSNPLGR